MTEPIEQEVPNDAVAEIVLPVTEVAPAVVEEPVPDPRIAELEAQLAAANAKIELMREAKNSYRKMAGFAARDMKGAHDMGDVYASRRAGELSREFEAIQDVE